MDSKEKSLNDYLMDLSNSVKESGISNDELFSINEWNSCSIERRKSISLFIAMAVPASFIEDCDDMSFDDETKKFLQEFSPFENVRDYFKHKDISNNE